MKDFLIKSAGFLLYCILAIVLVFFQNTLIPFLAIKGVSVDLLLLFIVFTALRRPAAETVFWGGLTGFLADMFVPASSGALMLGYALVAFILANSRETFNLDRPLHHGSMIFILGIIQKIIAFAMGGFRLYHPLTFTLTTLFIALLTALCAVGLDILIRLLFGNLAISQDNP